MVNKVLLGKTDGNDITLLYNVIILQCNTIFIDSHCAVRLIDSVYYVIWDTDNVFLDL